MVSTAHLTEIHRVCQAAQAKLLLVGDPHQLAPVGPGGALVDIARIGIWFAAAAWILTFAGMLAASRRLFRGASA